MRINEDFSFYRLYHGIYATICSRRTPAKACLLKLYFPLQFSKALSNRQYRRFSFRVNQDIFVIARRLARNIAAAVVTVRTR